MVVVAARLARLRCSGQRGNGCRVGSLDQVAWTESATGDGNRRQEGRHQDPHQNRPRHLSPQDQCEGRILRTVTIIGIEQE
jgi:hypothetical protein